MHLAMALFFVAIGRPVVIVILFLPYRVALTVQLVDQRMPEHVLAPQIAIAVHITPYSVLLYRIMRLLVMVEIREAAVPVVIVHQTKPVVRGLAIRLTDLGLVGVLVASPVVVELKLILV